MEKVVARADQAVEARFLEAEVGEVFGALFLVEAGEFGLDLGGDDDGGRAFLGGTRLDSPGLGVAGCGGGFVDVADIEDGLRGQQL